MKRVYVYMHHQGFDFYLKHRALTPVEMYCEYCEESDTLIGVYDNGQELGDKLKELFAAGYDLLPDEEYILVAGRYCPQ